MPAPKLCLLSLLTLLALASPASALDDSRALTQYAHRIWQNQQGLPQATIYCVRQTKSGYLWLGTLTGPVRFDGVRFTRIDKLGKNNNLSLLNTPILDLAEDANGTLWFATDGQGVIGLHSNQTITQISTAQTLPSTHVTRLFVDNKNQLWIATTAGLSRWADNKLNTWTTANGLATNDLRTICQTADGRIVAAGASPVLSFLSGNSFQTHRLQSLTLNSTIQSLAPAANGALYAGTSTGIVHLDADNKERRLTTADGLADNYIWSLNPTPDLKTIYVGTGDGISRLRIHTASEEIDTFQGRDALSQSTVYGTFQDREGSLWIATKHGLNQFLDGRTVPVTIREGLASNNTGPILQDAAGVIWVGTLDAGLSRFDGQGFSILNTANGLPSNRVNAFARAPHGALWIGTNKGLARLHQNQATPIEFPPQISSDIRALLTHSNGELYVGTAEGLALLHDNKLTPIEGVPREPVTTLIPKPDGSILAANTDGALITLKDGTLQSVIEPGPSARPIDALRYDSSGLLWIGTIGGGLRLVDGQKTTHFTMREGLFDDDIFSIIADNKDRLWLACSKGVFYVSISELKAYAAGTARQITSNPFSPTDALRTIECKSGVEPAAFTMADGRMWFATTRGVVILDPARLPRRLPSPPVVVEEIAVDGRPESPEAIASLPAGRKNLMFKYAGLSFIAPTRIRFRYQLEGFDQGWIDAGARREAFYTNLPPGNYHFRVQATNTEGVWTDPDIETAAVAFAMPRAWYQHAWFIPACVLATVALAAMLFQMRVRALRQRMQLVVAERSRIARELHDTLLQGFAGVTMEMQALSVRLPNSTERRTLEDIIRDAALCLKEARRSVAGLRDRAGTAPGPAAGFAALVETAAREVTAGSPLQLSLNTQQASNAAIKLPGNVEYNLMRIAREAMSNAVAHSNATTLAVTLSVDHAHLLLEIKDDGDGILHSTNHGHFGIIGMRERAQEIGAGFDLDSAPEKGTTIAIRLPLSPIQPVLATRAVGSNS
jgi:ligand-binding sensor domain-containing protein/signal transduction histidine kinase